MAIIQEALSVPPAPRERAAGATQLILWVTLPFLLCFFALICVSAWDDRRRALDDLGRSTAETARQLSETMARVVESGDLLLKQSRLVDRAARRDDEAAMQALATYLAASREQLAYVDAILLIGADGNLLVGSAAAGTPVRPDYAWAERDLFRAHVAADGGLYVGVLVGDGGDQLFLSRRLDDAAGRFTGVIALTVKSGYFERLFRESRNADDRIAIVRADLSMLVQSPLSAAAQFPALFRGLIQASAAGSWQSIDENGGVRQHAYRQAAGYPLYVDVAASSTGALTAWRAQAIPALIPMVGVWFVCIAFAWYAYRRGQAEDRYRLALAETTRQLETKVRERTAVLETTVGQLRQVVQEKETLFQELNHRVKNNLQLISSLLGLQVAKVKDPEARSALAISLERVHSISLVHELLYHRDDLAVLDVPVYLQALVARIDGAFFGDGRISCTIDADPVQLPPETCIRLALIVNEVVTNAAKHAFPDGRRGHITLAFRSGDTQYRLSVADDGVGDQAGAGDAGAPGHNGLQIVDMLARYLDGSCTRDSGPFGTIVTVGFPRQF